MEHDKSGAEVQKSASYLDDLLILPDGGYEIDNEKIVGVEEESNTDRSFS